jgi:hypothetical protein
MVPFRFWICCILGALLFFKSNAPESARGVKTPIALSALLCRVKIFTTSYISEPRSLPPPSYFDIFARPARVRFQRFPALKRAHVVEPCSFTTTRGMPRPLLAGLSCADIGLDQDLQSSISSQIMASLTPKASPS